MQSGEKCAVLESFGHERVDLLLEGQIDPDADGTAVALWVGAVNALVGSLHQTRAAAGDDVTVQASQLCRQFPDSGVNPVVVGNAGRAEDGHAITVAFCRPQPCEVV